MPRIAPPILAAVLLAAFTAAAHAQAPVNDNRAVDQGVEDVDPRAVSFRVIDPGNAQYPTRSMIVERPHSAGWSQLGLPTLDEATGLPNTRRYEYRAPGVRAQMNRPDYLVIDQAGERALSRAPIMDGAFSELPPPDTVFSLVPERPQSKDPAVTDPTWRDQRVDGRINRRAGQAADSYHPGRLNPPLPEDRKPTVQRFEIRRLHGKKYDDAKEAQPQEPQAKPDEKEKPNPENKASENAE